MHPLYDAIFKLQDIQKATGKNPEILLVLTGGTVLDAIFLDFITVVHSLLPAIETGPGILADVRFPLKGKLQKASFAIDLIDTIKEKT